MTEPSFNLHTHGRFLLRQGDPVSVEFPDDKGVAGRIAGVDIDPGGSPFRVVVTGDGRMPDDRPETVSEEADASPGGDVAQEALSDVVAALRANLERADRQARTIRRQQQVEGKLRAELAKSRDTVASRDQTIRELRAEVVDAREHSAGLFAEMGQLRQKIEEREMTPTKKASREWPSLRVMTWHEVDGSVTIRIEEKEN